jgi:leucyl/phenylalanyl-tRNA--protein transferase
LSELKVLQIGIDHDSISAGSDKNIYSRNNMTTIEGFPDHQFATDDGLLALGGDLSPERLLLAYAKGIFPWYNPGEPILWWSPDPRCVLFPDDFHPSKSLKKSIRKNNFSFTFNTHFNEVIDRCSQPRVSGPGTWITQDMKNAYIKLHNLGYAHSVETWKDGELVGGLYGISLGKVFFGESMFSTVADASKAALDYLIQGLITCQYKLIDCQITSDHLISLGAREITRDRFIDILDHATQLKSDRSPWNMQTAIELREDPS